MDALDAPDHQEGWVPLDRCEEFPPLELARVVQSDKDPVVPQCVALPADPCEDPQHS